MKPAIFELYKRVDKGEPVLKAIRSQLGMSQQTFAETIGVGASTVSRWERGVNPVTLNLSQIQRFETLLKKLNLTFSDIPDNMTKEGQ